MSKTGKQIQKYTILTIDDESVMLDTYQSILKRQYKILGADDPLKGLEVIRHERVDLVLLDLRMPGLHGLQALEEIKKLDPQVDVIVVSASTDLRGAIECMKKGAYDFVPKPFEVEELLSSVTRCLEQRRLEQDNQYLRKAVEAPFENMIGQSTSMQKVFGVMDTVAESDSTVLILGESGTGKELVARGIHKKSIRRNRPVITLNCAAIPENLFESELFGFERGAFTGALERQIGKFELADGGTIFLDEIGCLPLSMQGKLLRVIQDGTFDRIGGKTPVEVDVRILAATNVDLKREVDAGRFRQDLFYRLNVIPIILPPLRQRIGDVPLLANYFIEKFAKDFHKNCKSFTPDVLEAFEFYSWPGNVRELENVVERMVVLSQSEILGPIHLPSEVRDGGMIAREIQRESDGEALKDAVEAFEQKFIQKILEDCKGNQTQAAKILGVHRTTLVSKLKISGSE